MPFPVVGRRCVQQRAAVWQPEKREVVRLANRSQNTRDREVCANVRMRRLTEVTARERKRERGARKRHCMFTRLLTSPCVLAHLAHLLAVSLRQEHLECTEARIDTLHASTLVGIGDFAPYATLQVATSHLRQVATSSQILYTSTVGEEHDRTHTHTHTRLPGVSPARGLGLTLR